MMMEASTSDKCEAVVPGSYEKDKVYVGNIRHNISSHQLKDFFNRIVPVTSANIIFDRETGRSRGFGFVTVKYNKDVDVLLKLKPTDTHYQGKSLRIRKATKRISTHQFKSYMSRRCFDNPYDLSSPDSSKATIHCLVDDTLRYIFSFLKDEDAIRIERVCRRWQNLVYDRFSSIKALNIPSLCERLFFGRDHSVKLGALIKYVILTGENLEEIKFEHKVSGPSFPFLQTIGAVCKSLKTIDISFCATFSERCVKTLRPALKSVNKIIARGCSGLKDQAVDLLLSSCPQLECLDLVYTNLKGWSLHKMPQTITELHMGSRVELKSLAEISKSCPRLKILELFSLKNDFCYLATVGINCPDISDLTIHVENCDVDYAFLTSYSKLNSLHISAKLQRHNVGRLLPYLQSLQHLRLDVLGYKGSVDFSVLKNIKGIILTIETLPEEDLETLAQCSTLETVQIKGRVGNIEIVYLLLKKCPNLVKIDCRNILYDISMLKPLQKATANLKNRIEFVFSVKESLIYCSPDLTLADIVDPKFVIKFECRAMSSTWDDVDFSDDDSFDSIYSDFEYMDDGLLFLGLDDPEDWFDDFSMMIRNDYEDYFLFSGIDEDC